jgi:hypothetical protein
MLNIREGRDIRCQLRRNSSINFAMRYINRSTKPNQGRATPKYAVLRRKHGLHCIGKAGDNPHRHRSARRTTWDG